MKKVLLLYTLYLLSNCNAQNSNAHLHYNNPADNQITTLIISSRNLNLGTFTNGDAIFEARTKEDWLKAARQKIPAWCYYDNDPKNGHLYGKIYNYYALKDPRGLCPDGWRKIRDTDIEIIEQSKISDTAIKSRTGWDDLRNGTNNSSLNLVPGGYRDEDGNFVHIGRAALFWMNSDRNLFCPFWGISYEKYLFHGHGFFASYRYSSKYSTESQSYFYNNIEKMGFYIRTVCLECDSDGDLVEDHKDKCPNLAGIGKIYDSLKDKDQSVNGTWFESAIAGEGCPDTDDDGVFDHIDVCPNVSGTVANIGCPGLPPYFEGSISFKTKQNGFEIILSPENSLHQLIQLLNANPNLNVAIQGSSDYEGPILINENEGYKDGNFNKNYVKAGWASSSSAGQVRAYLTKFGISESRITVLHLNDLRIGKSKLSWKTKENVVEFKTFL